MSSVSLGETTKQVSTANEDEDRPCEAGKDCVPAESCEVFKAEREKLNRLSRGSEQRKMLLEKLRSLVCNKQDKKICCEKSAGNPSSQGRMYNE